MSDEITPYPELVKQFNVACDFGGPVPKMFAEALLEQIRRRDVTIELTRQTKLSVALALSSGNKANATNSRGETIIVQELVYSPVTHSHTWRTSCE